MKAILVNAGLCSGCRLCEMVCSFNHEKEFGSSLSRITVIKEDIFGIDLPVVCSHCNPCSVLENCPSQALGRNKEDLVSVDEEKCIGCGICLEKCIIGAVKLHPKRKIPLICDQCGGKPLCVERCPTKALTYKESNQQTRLPNQIIEEILRRWRIID